MEGQGCLVPDRLFKGIPAEISLLIFFCTERPECIPVDLVDGGSRQSEEECIGEGCPHLPTEISFLGPVCLIDHDDDVVPGIEHSFRFCKPEDGGDDDLPGVLRKKALEFFPGGSGNGVGDLGCIERRGDLGIEIDPVHNDDDRGTFQERIDAEFLGGKDHEERFAAALEVPDESLLGFPVSHPLDNQVGCIVLLVPADDLDLLVLFVGGKDGEILYDVENNGWSKECPDCGHDRGECRGIQVDLFAPRGPAVNGDSHCTIVECFSFGCEGEGIRHEQRRDGFFIGFIDIIRCIEPGLGWPDRGLAFPDDKRDTVHEQDDIHPLGDGAG